MIKNGDKVKIVGPSNIGVCHAIGSFGKMLECNSRGYNPYYVEGVDAESGDTFPLYYPATSIEEIPQLAVGDKVKIVGPCNIGQVVALGTVGTITVVDDKDTSMPYRVKAKREGEDRDVNVWYPAEAIEAYIEAAQPVVQQGEEKMEKGFSKWFTNTTGEQPVSDDVRVQTILQDGFVCGDNPEGRVAQWLTWGLNRGGDTIVKYRVMANADGWIENSGVQPVADGVRIDIKFFTEDRVYADVDPSWRWTIEDRDDCDIQYWRLAEVEQEAEDDGWIINTTSKFGDMPVAEGTKVEVVYRSGKTAIGFAGESYMMGKAYFQIDQYSSDIVKYRVLEMSADEKIARLTTENEDLREENDSLQQQVTLLQRKIEAAKAAL